jgi:hypothetical protein
VNWEVVTDERGRVHTCPRHADLPDIEHLHPDAPRVDAPLEECVLCGVGLCTQRVVDDVIVHARSFDS